MQPFFKTLFVILMVAAFPLLETTGCQAAVKEQPGLTVEITKKKGEKMSVTNFKTGNHPYIYINLYSFNINIQIPLKIISRITVVDNEATVLMGDNSTIKGHWQAGFTFNTDLGEAGISSDDIKELVFKQQASISYVASPHGKHWAILYLRDGKQIELSGATFRATKFDRSPKYKYPLAIGDEYPNSVRFDADTGGTYNILSWEQIKSIAPLDSDTTSKSGGLVDCKIIVQNGRELIGWCVSKVEMSPLTV
jgi:hypothetical protein